MPRAEVYTGPPDPAYINEWNANLKAIRLRQRGVSYSAIATVIDEFFGVRLSPDGWRTKLRTLGAEPRPHGVGANAWSRV